jgi:hypothetical protein
MTKTLELQFKDFAAGCMDEIWQGQLDLIKDNFKELGKIANTLSLELKG